MRWNSPYYLYLIFLIPVAMAYRFVLLNYLKKGGIRFPLARRAMEHGRSWRVRLSIIPDLLRFATFVLLVMSLMQPQWGISTETVNRRGVDIVLAIDISGSMAAEDFKPNRMEATKKITENFITGLQDHRIGLVIFAGISVTQCPLTLDYGAVVELLRRTSMDSLKVGGTAIGDGLTNSVYTFKREPGDMRDQVVILLSDGENNAGVVDPLDAARIAAQRGVKVYTIAVGSLEGAPLPVTDQFGRRQYARNRDGSLHIAGLDEQLLKDIAYITKGQYFRATDNESLEKIYKAIAELESGDIGISRTIQYAERFYWFLAPALALLAIEMYLRSRVFVRLF